MLYIYEYFISFIVSFIIAFSSTPIAKKIAYKFGAIDIPRDNRRMHKKPIAKLGGLAIVSGFIITVLFNVLGSILDINGIFNDFKQIFALLLGVMIIVVMGILDDIKDLSAKYKLIFQFAAALTVVLAGTRIAVITNPFSQNGMSELNIYISYAVTIIWIVGITNAINFIDGLDGLAAGVASIASLSLFFVSVIMGDTYSAIITVIIAGSTLGFLPYNFNPAKIFMADTGSNFLGFTLGVISIQGTMKGYAAIAIAIPLLVLGLPLFDTIFAIFRRLLKGKSIMEADRGHLHHRLIDMGLSQKQSVVLMYVISAALGLCAIVLADKGALSAIILVISISVFVIGGARYMNEIKDDKDDDDDDDQDDKDDDDQDGEGNDKHAIKPIEKVNKEETKKREDITSELL